MTTASELKRSAVVEVESEIRKTNLHNATDLDQRWSRHDDTGFTSGSTTAPATKMTATKQVASAKAFFTKVEIAISGSKAAVFFKAASIQAIRLPVSVFSTNSRLFPTIQQNPVPLWRVMPERVLRANRAA